MSTTRAVSTRGQNLETFQIYKNLAWLNELPAAEAEQTFLDCCGSKAWASRMAEARPFKMLDDLFTAAEALWFSLPPADWLEAFAAHPKIGSKKPARTQERRAADWSKDEQAGVDDARETVKQELAAANRLYLEKFGFIFIICATGKTAEEMLADCVSRLSNSLQAEINVAAEEQQKITELRLKKLLEK